MKTIKLNKKMLSLELEELLEKLGAVKKEIHKAFPEHVYLSKDDYKTLQRNVEKRLKKDYSDYSKKHIKASTQYRLLEFGPNESLGNVLKKGYAVVDLDSIEKSTQELKEIIYG
jgi:hypothetical protein